MKKILLLLFLCCAPLFGQQTAVNAAHQVNGLIPATNLGTGTPSSSTCLYGNQNWAACGSGMVWPTGSTPGIMNYGGSSAYGSLYNASNPIPPLFLGTGTPTSSTCLLGNQTWGSCGSGGFSGMTAGQVPIANSPTTGTSSMPLVGGGTAIVAATVTSPASAQDLCYNSSGVLINCYSGVPVDASNPATLLASDRSSLINWTSGSTLTLPAATGAFASNFAFTIKNTSGGTLALTPSSPNNIDGGTSQAPSNLLNNWGAYVYQDSTPNWWTVKFPMSNSLPGFGDYVFSVSGGTVSATNQATGNVDYSGTDGAAVFRSVATALVNVGGRLKFKAGTYNCNSVVAETVSPYTSHVGCFVIPSTNAVVYPSWIIDGEQSGIGSQVHPPTTGVIFAVTSTAVTAAGSNTLDAVWMRPNTALDTEYPAGSLYWNSHVTVSGITVLFPANTVANEVAFDFLEASYLNLQDSQWGFVTAPTALGAAGTIGLQSPAAPSDGVYVANTISDPGWNIGYAINTDHAILINPETWRNTNCYEYGYAESRNASVIYHSGQWIHPQVYNCVNGIVAGSYISPGVQLDILGLDFEYITTGVWAYSTVFTPGNNLSGFLSWNNIQTNVGPGSLTTPFPPGQGNLYTVEFNGGLNAPTGVTTQEAVFSTKASYAFTTVENPLSDGGNFTNATYGSVTGTVQVPSSGVAEPGTTSSNGRYLWTGRTWSPNQCSSVTVTTLSPTGNPSVLILFLRSDAASTGTDYQFNIETGTSGIFKTIAGTQTLLTSGTLTVSSGDVWQACANGTALTLAQNGTVRLTTTDSSVVSGYPGFALYNTSAVTGTQISAWSGSDVSSGPVSGGLITASVNFQAPQYCIGASCITAWPTSSSSGLSGMTATQIPIANSPSTITSSMPVNVLAPNPGVFVISNNCSGQTNCLQWTDDDSTDNCGTATTTFFATVNAYAGPGRVQLYILGSGVGKAYKLATASCNIPLTIGSGSNAAPFGAVLHLDATIDCAQPSGDNCIQLGATGETQEWAGEEYTVTGSGTLYGGASLTTAGIHVEPGVNDFEIAGLHFWGPAGSTHNFGFGANSTTLGSCVNYSIYIDTPIAIGTVHDTYDEVSSTSTTSGGCGYSQPSGGITVGQNTVNFHNNILGTPGDVGTTVCGSEGIVEGGAYGVLTDNIIYGFSVPVRVQGIGTRITDNEGDTTGCVAHSVNALINWGATSSAVTIAAIAASHNIVQTATGHTANLIAQAGDSTAGITDWVVDGNLNSTGSFSNPQGALLYPNSAAAACTPNTKTGKPCYAYGNQGFYTYLNAAGWVSAPDQLPAYQSSTTLAANLGATPIYTAPNVTYFSNAIEVSCATWIMQAATTSSTLPSCVISWTDSLTSVVETFTVTATSAANVKGAYPTGVVDIYPKVNTTVSVSTTGYASSGGTAMNYFVNAGLRFMQ